MKNIALLIFSFLAFSTITAQEDDNYYYSGIILDPISRVELNTKVEMILSADNVLTIEEYNDSEELLNITTYSFDMASEGKTALGDEVLNFSIKEDENALVSIVLHENWVIDIIGYEFTFEITEGETTKHIYTVNSTDPPIAWLDGDFMCWYRVGFDESPDYFSVKSDNEKTLEFFGLYDDQTFSVNIDYNSSSTGSFDFFRKEFDVSNNNDFTRAKIIYLSKDKTNTYADFKIILYDGDAEVKTIMVQRAYSSE